VLQAPTLDGFSFDPFSPVDDCLSSAEVGVCRCDVFQALVITQVVVMLDERFDLRFQITGQEVVFQQDAVHQGLVPRLTLAFDLTLRLKVERRIAHMALSQHFGKNRIDRHRN